MVLMKEKFLLDAINLSIEKMKEGCGGPFGAVIVRHDKIVAYGWNQVTSMNDPTAHAEIIAIRQACSNLNTFNLSDCEIYSSCEPCPMCLAAIYWARLRGLFYAATREDASNAGFDDSRIYKECAADWRKRSIFTEQALRSKAVKAFDLWSRKADRIEY